MFSSIYGYYAALLAGRAASIDAGHNVVLTFNYDLLLEDALATLGIPFSYGLGTEGVSYDTSSRCIPTAGRDALTLLKMHGSMNWRLMEVAGSLQVFETYDQVVKKKGVPHLVPPTWDKTLTTGIRHVWNQAIDALSRATRVIIIGFSFRVVDSHLKYLLAAGLMGNSALRKIVVVNPEATRLAGQIQSIIRRDQFEYGIVELHDRKIHEYATSLQELDKIGRVPRHDALSIIEVDGVRLIAGTSGFVPG